MQVSVQKEANLWYQIQIINLTTQCDCSIILQDDLKEAFFRVVNRHIMRCDHICFHETSLVKYVSNEIMDNKFYPFF